MWCPNCNREYAEEFDTCLVCGGKLERYTPILSDEERDVLELQPENNELGEDVAPPEEILPELLVTVAGEEEARRLAALLENFRIPCLCRPAQDVVPPEMEYETDDFSGDETEDWVQEEEMVLDTDEPLFDLSVPKMMLRKALRLLQEDEARQEERREQQEKSEPAPDREQVRDNEEPKPKKSKGFFGLFGKKSN